MSSLCKTLVAAAASAVFAAIVPGHAHAQQKYPTKPIRLVIAFTAGGIPDLPALPEILPGASRDGSQMWLAPAGTPRAVLQQLSREVARALAVPEVKERLTNIAFHVAPALPEETDRMLRNDIAAFTKVVADAGLRGK